MRRQKNQLRSVVCMWSTCPRNHQWIVRGLFLNAQQTYVRLIGALYFGLAVPDRSVPGKSLQWHFHIRLTRSKPDVTNHDVINRESIRAFHINPEWPTSSVRGQIQAPLTKFVCCRLCGLAVQGNAYLLIGIGPAPKVYRPVPLQHHVATQNLGQAHFRPAFKVPKQCCCYQEEKSSHRA